ncbi:Sensor protein fixL [uncultured Woeseiaceae bacterium]|uniref:Sensor protein FixL n=1 Tax=uncultured Woeseiaceae bacterium TaxID=1983305 RepID=A0A7D9D1W3_9GAMM|nr:Sensor protein fixL [uncultured Woeseiaceae bacterium]
MTDPSEHPAPDSHSYAAPEWKALLDAAVDAIIVIDHRGRIETFNSAAEVIFGFSAEEVLGKNVSLLMPEPYRSEHDGYIGNYLDSGNAKIIGLGREVQGKRQNGLTFPIGLSVGEIPTGDQPKFVGIIRDITDRKRIEEETHQIRERLSQFGRLSTLGEMAAGLAHELNQPLTAIATYTQACQRLIESGRSDDDEILATLKKCDSQAQRAGDVIRRLRQFVQKRELGRQEVSCDELIRDLAALAEVDARTNGITLTIDVAAGLPKIIVDAVQIQQVILNLIRNGIDAMLDMDQNDEGISVSVIKSENDKVKIAVTDHGSGITKEAEKKIFQPFFTTKSSGLGLGLAICQSIIASHGGVLSFTKNPSGGTTFHFMLPVISEAKT